MSDLRVSFPVLDANDGRASLNPRSFRQAAVALATGKMARQTTQQPVYIVAPERRRLAVPVLVGAIAATGVSALAMWLL